MRIFVMECLKMCVVVGLALTAPGRPAAAAPSPTNAYVYQQHKRSPVNPNLDLTSGLTTDFGGFGPSSTLPDFGYGSGFPSTAAGFRFDDATAGFGRSAGLLHLSHPYAATAFGSGFGSVGYPFSDSTQNQLQFKPTLASGLSPSLPVSVKYSPSVPNVGPHHTRITGFPATENSKLTAQSTVSLQQTRPNEQRVLVESFKAAPAPLQQTYSASTSSVPQQQTYPVNTSPSFQQLYVTAESVPQRQSYSLSGPVPQQQSYSSSGPVPQQQSYSSSGSTLLQQSYPAAESVQPQQSYSSSGSVQQQSYSNSGPVPQQQSYSSSGPVPQQQSYSSSGPVLQQQSYSFSRPVPQQQSYSSSGPVPQQQSYSLSGSVPQQQSYSSSGPVPQQQSYSSSGSALLQQSYPAANSVQQQQSYQTTLTEPKQQTYVTTASTQPQQSYPATAGDLRNSAYYQPPTAGSAPDLILELRPPPYTVPASSVDYQQNVNIPSTPPSSYQPADSNNNINRYPGNDFGLLTAPVAGTSVPNQVSNAPNGGPLSGNTNNFIAVSSNAKPDQTPSNTYYTVPLPVSGGSNSVSSDVPNYFSIPNIAYSLTSSVNSEFAGSTRAPSTAPVSSIGTDRSVLAAANPTGGPSPSYRDPNSIPSVSYPSSNSISANSYSDSNSIQSSSYTIPSSPVDSNSYSNYKLNTDNFYVDSNSISANSKRESSTVNASEKFPRIG